MPTGEYDVCYRTQSFRGHLPDLHDQLQRLPRQHETTLAAANAMTVTGENCFSCHESMDSWDFAASGLTFHEAFAPTEDCTVCHNASGVASGKVVVTDFHNGLETERVGIIYGGEDLSVTEGKKFTWQITSVVDDGTNLAISLDGDLQRRRGESVQHHGDRERAGVLPVGPNTANEGTLSMLRSYAQGDDYVLGQASAPGQASGREPVDHQHGLRRQRGDHDHPGGRRHPGRHAGHRGPAGQAAAAGPGRHVDKHWTYPLMFVRVPTPTYEFIVGTGAKASTPRREIADTGAVPEVPCRLALSARQHPR